MQEGQEVWGKGCDRVQGGLCGHEVAEGGKVWLPCRDVRGLGGMAWDRSLRLEA